MVAVVEHADVAQAPACGRTPPGSRRPASARDSSLPIFLEPCASSSTRTCTPARARSMSASAMRRPSSPVLPQEGLEVHRAVAPRGCARSARRRRRRSRAPRPSCRPPPCPASGRPATASARRSGSHSILSFGSRWWRIDQMIAISRATTPHTIIADIEGRWSQKVLVMVLASRLVRGSIRLVCGSGSGLVPTIGSIEHDETSPVCAWVFRARLSAARCSRTRGALLCLEHEAGKPR